MQWVLPPELSPLRLQLERLLGEQGVPRPTPHIETTSQMLVEILLDQTDPVAAMPASVAQMCQARGQIAILDLFLPISMPPVGLLRHADAVNAPAVTSFLALVREVGAQQPTAIPSAGMPPVR
jgi:DNA-binding transcriptional LysR family regulator